MMLGPLQTEDLLNRDMERALDGFAADVAVLPAGSVPQWLIERTAEALRAALLFAAGQPDEAYWHRLYHAAGGLVQRVDDRSALPWLRAFLSENRDLCDQP